MIIYTDRKVELCEDEGHPRLGHEAGDARVPRGVPLEPAVQGGHNVRLAVAGAGHVVLVQARRLECVLHLKIMARS